MVKIMSRAAMRRVMAVTLALAAHGLSADGRTVGAFGTRPQAPKGNQGAPDCVAVRDLLTKALTVVDDARGLYQVSRTFGLRLLCGADGYASELRVEPKSYFGELFATWSSEQSLQDMAMPRADADLLRKRLQMIRDVGPLLSSPWLLLSSAGISTGHYTYADAVLEENTVVVDSDSPSPIDAVRSFRIQYFTPAAGRVSRKGTFMPFRLEVDGTWYFVGEATYRAAKIGTRLEFRGARLRDMWGSRSGSQDSENQNRVARSQSGVALATLIRPGMQTLTVEKGGSPALNVNPPPGTGQLEWITSLSDYVAVIRIENLAPQLTPDGSWITTTVTGRLQNVLRAPSNQRRSDGDTIEFTQEGGDMAVSGVAVHAILPWSDGFELGERYLVFAKVSRDAQWLLSESDSYKIVPTGRIAALGNPTSAASAAARSENGITLEAAIARVRAVKRNGNQ